MLHITAAQSMYNLVIHLQLVPHMILVPALLMFQAAFGCSPGIIPQHAGRSLCVPPAVFLQLRQMLPLLQKSYMYASVSNNDAAHYGRFFFFSKSCLEAITWLMLPTAGFSVLLVALLTVVCKSSLPTNNVCSMECYCIRSGLIKKRICILVSF